jgi:hypothetical protein
VTTHRQGTRGACPRSNRQHAQHEATGDRTQTQGLCNLPRWSGRRHDLLRAVRADRRCVRAQPSRTSSTAKSGCDAPPVDLGPAGIGDRPRLCACRLARSAQSRRLRREPVDWVPQPGLTPGLHDPEFYTCFLSNASAIDAASPSTGWGSVTVIRQPGLRTIARSPAQLTGTPPTEWDRSADTRPFNARRSPDARPGPRRQKVHALRSSTALATCPVFGHESARRCAEGRLSRLAAVARVLHVHRLRHMGSYGFYNGSVPSDTATGTRDRAWHRRHDRGPEWVERGSPACVPDGLIIQG